MANTFEYATWLSMECLDLLESKRGISKHFNTNYNAEFKKPFAVGETVNVPYPAQFTSRRGLSYVPQDVTRRSTSITFDEPFQIGFEWDSAEAALRAPRGRDKVKREILDPAMTQMLADIESACALYAYQNAASVVGSLGTNPTTYDATSAAARQVMQELGSPDSGDRAMIVSPAVMRSIKSANITLNNPASDLTKQFRKGYVQTSDGFDWHESNFLYRHTAGTWAGAVSLASAPANGATSLSLTVTSGDILKKGDKISIANVLPVHPQTRRAFGTSAKTFTITSADQTISGTSATVSISPAIYYEGPYQNVNSQPAAAAALTLWPGTTSPSTKAGQVGVALHSDAFALVGVELEEPKGSSVELVSQSRDPISGISVRFIRQWDSRESKFINRFDCMIGFGTFYNDACAVAVAMG